MIEHQIENEDTVVEMDFGEFTITGDSYYDVFEEEYEIIYLNDIVWVKVSEAIW